jgi:hypothetical protein
MKNFLISIDLSIDELAILLGMLEQTVESDRRGVPKEYIREVKLLYKKLVKVAEKVESELSN